MSKNILAIVSVLLAIILGIFGATPIIMGYVAHAEYQETIELVNKQSSLLMAGSSEVSMRLNPFQYEKGWWHSSAKTQLTYQAWTTFASEYLFR
jgi:hypothetical protein